MSSPSCALPVSGYVAANALVADAAVVLSSRKSAWAIRRVWPKFICWRRPPKAGSGLAFGYNSRVRLPRRSHIASDLCRADSTWADWDDAQPGFVEIDLVAHDGGNAAGEYAFTLTVTDIATGWTENRSVPSKAAKCVLAALEGIATKMPFPILGVDSDNGSEFINVYLFLWCRKHQITFSRSRPANKNDGCHVEQKNWAVVRTVVGYHRYDTASELLLLNEIWRLQSMLANYFYPQQKLISKVRDGAKVSRKYDTATTPFRRAVDHQSITDDRKVALARTHALINPAAMQRQIQTLTAQLLTLTTSKTGPKTKAPVPTRAPSNEATNPPSRAS